MSAPNFSPKSSSGALSAYQPPSQARNAAPGPRGGGGVRRLFFGLLRFAFTGGYVFFWFTHTNAFAAMINDAASATSIQ